MPRRSAGSRSGRAYLGTGGCRRFGGGAGGDGPRQEDGRDHPSTVAARDLATRLLGRAPIEDWVGEETGREVERLGGRLADVNV